MIFRYPGRLIPLFQTLGSTSSSPSIRCLRPRLLYTVICGEHHIHVTSHWQWLVECKSSDDKTCHLRRMHNVQHAFNEGADTQASILTSPPSMPGILPVRHSHIHFHHIHSSSSLQAPPSPMPRLFAPKQTLLAAVASTAEEAVSHTRQRRNSE